MSAWDLFVAAVGGVSLLSVVAIPMWATWTTVRRHRGSYTLLAGATAFAWIWLLVQLI